jgi:hypothetical protein
MQRSNKQMENYMKTSCFSFALLLCVLVLGCGRGSNNPADSGTGGQSSSFTLGGTTYTTTSTAPLQNNVTQNIDGRTVTLNNFVADAFGLFVASENGTACFITGSSNNTSVNLLAEFPGRATGNFQLNSGQAGMLIVIGSTQYAATSGQLSITEYANPSGKIRSTFSGTFRTVTGGTNVQVTNGSFTVTRASDIQ